MVIFCHDVQTCQMQSAVAAIFVLIDNDLINIHELVSRGQMEMAAKFMFL
jgi:hypothetical protein